MPTIETVHHEPIVYEVHDYIVDRSGEIISVETLCIKFFGKHTKSFDTKMRNIVEEIVNDRAMQKIIISTHDGYLCPTKEQEELVVDSLAKIEKTAKALFYRRGSLVYRIQRDGQFKMAIGHYDSKIYESYADEEKSEAELAELAKRETEERNREYDRRLTVPEQGQVSMII